MIARKRSFAEQIFNTTGKVARCVASLGRIMANEVGHAPVGVNWLWILYTLLGWEGQAIYGKGFEADRKVFAT